MVDQKRPVDVQNGANDPELPPARQPEADAGQLIKFVGVQRALRRAIRVAPIFRTPVSRLRRLGKQGAIVERIEVDHAPDAVTFGQQHDHVDAASAAHDLL